jgi:hypothetical protein
MKTKLYAGLAAGAALVASLLYFTGKRPLPEPEDREAQKARFSEYRTRYFFDMLKDPKTGTIPEGIREKEIAFARTLPVRTYDNVAAASTNRTQLNNTYLPAGPNNIGGRTRAVAYDRRYNGTTNRVIIAGCVSGGILRSADGGTTWTLVTPQGDIHNFTALAQDGSNPDTWYAGGGEVYGNSASELGATFLGFGLWKSTDNGVNWTKLPLNNITDVNGSPLGGGTLEAFDHPFDFVHRIAVNPTNGHVFVAGHRRVMRSINGGSNFQVVLGSGAAANSSNGQTEVMVTNAGRVYAAVNGGNPDVALRGVWVSATGALNTFTRIAGGQTVGVDSVDGWRANDPSQGGKRIVMTLAPSNNDVAYVFYENGLSSDDPQLAPEADLFRLDATATTYTWSNRSANMPNYPNGNLSGSDPLTVQNGYDMVVRVYPTDPNIVFVGGTNLYRSLDGFATTNSTAWINGYQSIATFYNLYPKGHPDIHELVFNPVNPAESICANDGGVQVTSNILAGTGSFTTNTVLWSMLPNYQTLQYYYVAIDPDAGRNNFIGGSQDNSTHFRDRVGILGTGPADSNNHIRLVGGDGSSVGISKTNVSAQAQYIFGGSQFGNIRRIRVSGGSLSPSILGEDIKPTGLTTAFPGATNEFGEFVTNFRLNPDNTEDLYYVNFNRLFRTTSASSVAGGGWTELTGVSSYINAANGRNIAIRAVAFSRGPYASSHALYIGTTSGRILRVDDPRNQAAATLPVDITPLLPPGQTTIGNVQDISVNPNNDDEVMAVVSNYGLVSIYWTNNAKSASPLWRNAEGNLTLPSARSCAIVVKKDAANQPVTEYYVGTSVGLYSVANLGTTLTNGQAPVWQREGSTVLNYAVVQTMAYRPADNVLLVGTHGNGMFFTATGTPNFVPNQNTGMDPVTNDRNFIHTVYPTVTPDRVQFQAGNMTGIKKITVQVLDLSGRVVYRKESPYQHGSFGLNPFASGNYILSIHSDDGKYRHIQKLIKQ